MSKVWGGMLIISLVVAFFYGNVDVVITSIMESSKTSINNILELAGIICFWSGLFNIFQKTKAIKSFSKMFLIFINRLFNKKELTDEAIENISMNMFTNFVGIGNASTLNGIKAVEEMQKKNKIKDSPSDNMAIFILINTASIQLIPTSIIALRTMYGSTSPSDIVLPIWIVSCVSLFFGITSIKFLNKKI